jgi:hypothetical protein
MDTAGRDLDERELAYQKECQDYTQNQLSASFMQQEGQLAKEVKAEEAKLINFKTSQEMWKNSRILWTITQQYQHYQQIRKLAIQQKQTQGEEMKKKTIEILHRRAQVKKKNEDVWMRQMGMLQQNANNLSMQQDWMTNYLPGSSCE